MGRPKPLIPVLGKPLLLRILDNLRRAKVTETVVVLGSEADLVRQQVDLRGTTVVLNPEFESGMSSSLRRGVAALSRAPTGILVVLADQPFVDPATVRTLAARHAGGDGRIFIPTFEGVRGNPVLLDRSLEPELKELHGDIGCRALFPLHQEEIREVSVPDPGILIDVDTPQELSRLEKSLDGSSAPTAEVLRRLVADRLVLHGSAPVRSLRRTGSRPDILALATELERAHEPFALATVVTAQPPTSGKPGYKALVRANREVVGWIGGSCSSRVLVSEALRSMEEGTPRLLRLSPEAEEAAPPARGVVTRRLECASGGTMEIYVEPHLPEPELLIVGEGPIAKALAALGGFLGFRVLVVAPGARASEFPEGVEWEPDLARVGALARPSTFAVVASTGMYDETALQLLLPKTPRYVGLVASRRRAASVLASLGASGVPETQLSLVRNPAGVDIAARDPEEIALSVLGEVVRVRRSTPAPSSDQPTPPTVVPEPPSIDPICGMEVEASGPLRMTYRGQVYRFCSEGCLAKFKRSPAQFATA